FCAVFLSSFYLDVLKDRLYAEAPGSTARRQAQYVLAQIHRDLARLLAPIIPHTAEEVWSYLPPSLREAESVHVALFPESRTEPAQVSTQPKVAYHVVLQIREGILRELEKLRADKVIGSAQQARVEIGSLDVGYLALLKRSAAALEEACIVSEVLVHDERPEGAVTISGLPAEYWVRVGRSEYAKCERCWNHRKTVGADAEHPTLCERCARVIHALTTGA
ncbi:MAG: class I tRNA ligase family protein, partial [Planctomycetota bacterium]|nr:class I tRNA ligase family protein [Planctomycetota bacterium]